MPSRTKQFDDAHARVTAAGAAPELWPQALAAVRRALDSANVTLEIFAHGTPVPLFFQADGVPPASELRYLTDYAKLNPRAGHCGRLKTGQTASDYDFMTDAIMDRDPYYSEFLVPQDLRCFAVGVLAHTESQQRVVVANRSVRQGPADAALISGLRRLMPALRDALDTTVRLSDALNATADMTAALDWLTDGVALIDRQGNIIHVNSALAAMLRADDGLRLAQNTLEPLDASARRLLASAMATVVQHGEGGSVLVPRPSGARPYLISLRPATPGESGAPTRAAAFVFVTDTAGARAPSPDVLAASFGLTEAETQLALALHAGISPLDHARARGISDNTVYTHLRRLKEKTGTHRIPELMARIDAVRAAARNI